MRMAVYCGSREGDKPIFIESAKELGKALASSKIDLVYGGGSLGLMGAVATAAYKNGAHVIGVIPHFLDSREQHNNEISELVVVDDMHIRKKKMMDLADGFVMLPGGPGTFEEFFEVYTWKQLGLFNKPIYILNIDGYYNNLLRMLKRVHQSGFMSDGDSDLVKDFSSVDEFDKKVLRK